MTSNQHRAETLARSLRAGIDRDRQTLQELLTDDVRAWSPTLATAIAEFLDQRICSVRQYWDEHTVLEQLGVLTRDA